MTESVFSKIIARTLPAEIVYEDADTLAFLDVAPNNPGHTLVVPKRAYENIFDVPEEVWLSLQRTVHYLAPRIEKAMSAQGINIMVNNGTGAGQVVPHLHIHIIPRFPEDGYTHWPGRAYREGELLSVGARLRAALQQPAHTN